MYVGVDGCRGGWIAVTLDGDRRSVEHVPHLESIFGRPFIRLAVDCPIGLPENGDRACDLAARRMLRPHASRVFTGARRGLWDHPSQAEANRALKRRGEAMVSIQLWNIGPKILELDALVTADHAGKVIETHPELVFLHLNGGHALPPKKSAEGAALRHDLLAASGFAEIRSWTPGARRNLRAAADDVLDACAAALAARDARRFLPAGAAIRDPRGLPMQIWY